MSGGTPMEKPDDAETAMDQPVIGVSAPVPSFIVDGMIGTALAGGVIRITLGEMIYNFDPQAKFPAFRPAVNLAIPVASAKLLAEELLQTLEAYDRRAKEARGQGSGE